LNHLLVMDAHVFTVTALVIDSIPPVQSTWAKEYETQYQEAVIKAVIRINDTQQQEILYTYNKKGQLINSVVHKHEISIA
jgi:uncharacterized membrane protein